MNKQRILIITLAIAAGLGVAALLYLAEKNQGAGVGTLHAVTEDAFGGKIDLINQFDEKVSDKDFEGKYRLMFFGFTYCPAICPTELSKISHVMNGLGEDGKNIQPIYITVDPERDTPEVMKNYASLFHPSLVALTGSPEKITKTLKDFKIYAAKAKDERMSEYTMDHSTFTYFMAPDGRLLHIFKMEDTAPYMTQIITAWMAQESASKAQD